MQASNAHRGRDWFEPVIRILRRVIFIAADSFQLEGDPENQVRLIACSFFGL